MCISLDRAELTGTTIVLTKTSHPKTGSVIHSLLYQNTAQNLAPGPNAMFLYFPSLLAMDEENCIDTTGGQYFANFRFYLQNGHYYFVDPILTYPEFVRKS